MVVHLAYKEEVVFQVVHSEDKFQYFVVDVDDHCLYQLYHYCCYCYCYCWQVMVYDVVVHLIHRLKHPTPLLMGLRGLVLYVKPLI